MVFTVNGTGRDGILTMTNFFNGTVKRDGTVRYGKRDLVYVQENISGSMQEIPRAPNDAAHQKAVWYLPIRLIRAFGNHWQVLDDPANHQTTRREFSGSPSEKSVRVNFAAK